MDHEDERREELRQFEEVLQDTDKPWCWACGAGFEDAPAGWGDPWLIERAHIVWHPRCKTRHSIVLLCSLCHRVSHGERIHPYQDWPALTRENLLWLKKEHDPEFYDPDRLALACIGRLPEPRIPAAALLLSYHQRRLPPWAEPKHEGADRCLS